MKNLNIITVILLTMFTMACDDYVDIEPKGNAVAETLDDVDLLLNNGSKISGTLGTANLIDMLVNDNIKMPASDVEYLRSGTYDRFKAAIYELDDVFHFASETDYEWQYDYAVNARMNYVLRLIEELPGDQKLKDLYKGEALTHQAFVYFRLVNIYAPHYGLPAAAEAESGVPVLNDYANSQELTVPLSVNEVYNIIVERLNTAIPLLNEGRKAIDRPNVAAAKALLARVYLHMGDYAKAKDLAEEALTYNSELIDYGALPTNVLPVSMNNPEHVLMKEPYYWGLFIPGATRGMGMYSDELVAAFDDPVNDCRLSKIPGTDANGNYIIGAGYTYSSYRLPSGVTVPELMLIKAEALARENKVTEAMNVVNALRAKRFVTDAVTAGTHELDATDQQDAIDKVIAERRREFHVSGMRFFDMKRLNALHDAGLSLTRGDVTWEPNSINWAVPIPEAVIETSDGQIKQNPRE